MGGFAVVKSGGAAVVDDIGKVNLPTVGRKREQLPKLYHVIASSGQLTADGARSGPTEFKQRPPIDSNALLREVKVIQDAGHKLLR